MGLPATREEEVTTCVGVAALGGRTPEHGTDLSLPLESRVQARAPDSATSPINHRTVGSSDNAIWAVRSRLSRVFHPLLNYEPGSCGLATISLLNYG